MYVPCPSQNKQLAIADSTKSDDGGRKMPASDREVQHVEDTVLDQVTSFIAPLPRGLGSTGYTVNASTVPASF